MVRVFKWLSIVLSILMVLAIAIYLFTSSTFVITSGYYIGILFIISYGIFIFIKND